MPDALVDIDMPPSNYAVIYGDEPEEDRVIIIVEPPKSGWCPCW